jgi:hypothetical protein
MRFSGNLGKNPKLLLLHLLTFSLFVSGALTSSPSQAADTSPRIPRPLETIPRPSELTLGLSQIQYQGYFSRNPRWFSDSQFVATGIKNSNTLPSGITGIKGSTTTSPTSYSFTGYFIPDSTGEWQFQLTADDAGLVWLGNDAVINYSSKLATPFLEAYWPDRITNINKISMVKNSIYPLRIQYGNSGGPSELKLSYKSPGKDIWEENFSTLLWRSPELTGDCTNFGLSYTLSAELGYDKAIPAACTRDGSDKYVRSWIKLKPEIPSLISTKLSVSGLVLEVNLGDIEVSKTYLIAPGIGYTISSNLTGKINKKIATFLIPIAKLRNTSKIDISFVSTNNQGSTTTARKAIPVVLPKKSPPPAAKPTPKKTAPAPKTIQCEKGDKTRVFAGTTCPPGWSK